MSLPTKAIDRLFERLAATYTTQWVRQFDFVPLADVKTAWAHELSVFSSRLDVLAWALENLPQKCPNAIEFKALCRQAPRPTEQQLPAPKADPARVAAELSKLSAVVKRPSAGGIDHKAWAKVILARHDAGEKVRPISLRFAREALRMHLEPSQ